MDLFFGGTCSNGKQNFQREIDFISGWHGSYTEELIFVVLKYFENLSRLKAIETYALEGYNPTFDENTSRDTVIRWLLQELI